jgi:hypothetical protein
LKNMSGNEKALISQVVDVPLLLEILNPQAVIKAHDTKLVLLTSF